MLIIVEGEVEYVGKMAAKVSDELNDWLRVYKSEDKPRYIDYYSLEINYVDLSAMESWTKKIFFIFVSLLIHHSQFVRMDLSGSSETCRTSFNA